ncbi:hypothetical protein RhiLY_11420 [Ceratobasidium sp. AG-Ba]|nr:hypothetical protein RhiLY_11420 [Ceratobasidium sp. AG-Ba]
MGVECYQVNLVSRAASSLPEAPWAVTQRVTRAVGALATNIQRFTPTAIVRIVQEVAQKVTGQITENVDPFEDTAISETEDLDTETATRISEIQRLSASDPLAVVRESFKSLANLATECPVVSFDERSLLPPDAVAQETLEFQDFVGLDHLITLLELVEKAPLDYSLLKDNSWFFCQAIIDCMENYQPKPINLRRFFIGQDRRLQLKKDFAEAIGSKLRSYRYSP